MRYALCMRLRISLASVLARSVCHYRRALSAWDADVSNEAHDAACCCIRLDQGLTASNSEWKVAIGCEAVRESRYAGRRHGGGVGSMLMMKSISFVGGGDDERGRRRRWEEEMGGEAP